MSDMLSSSDGLATTLARIQTKLEQARLRKLECFGSKSHRFTLGPPLAKPEVAAFEEEHHISLPAEYRAFITTLGHSGAGPYYGLVPLKQAAAYLGTPSHPSALRPDMTATELEAMPDEELDALEDGAITLVQQGCAYSSVLIVTGEHRGAVVNLDPDLNSPPYFVRDDGFLAWYERWLDELLWGWDGGWFGFGLPGRETDLAAALITPPYTDRADALRTLARIPTLSPNTVNAVSACVDDSSAIVRSRATFLLGKHLGADAEPFLVARLADENPKVRIAALQAFASLPDGPERLRSALTDPEPDVVSFAVTLLSTHNQLTENDLKPLLQSAEPRTRMCAANYLRKAGVTTVPAFLFSDPDPLVVRVAMSAAVRMRDRQAMPHLARLVDRAQYASMRESIERQMGPLESDQSAG